MKLAWKMILSTVLIVALAVSFCGSVVLQTSLQTDLDAQFDSACEESELFCVTLGGLAFQAVDGSFQMTAAKAILQFLEGQYFQNASYQVLWEDGTLLAAAGRYAHQLAPEALQEGQVLSQLFHSEDHFWIETLQAIQVEEETYYICLFRDVTDVFQSCRSNLRTTLMAMVAAIAISTAIIVAMSMLLTAPIQRLSRTTEQMARGQYHRRAAVRSRDELGQLALDFNRMADSLEEKMGQLEDAAQRQRDFTASFAHELKTPLTSVIGYADTLRSRNLPPQLQMRAANYIFSEGKRLEAMSFALLDLFALEKGQPQLRPTRTRQAALGAGESLRYLLRQKKLQLQMDVADEEILAEPQLLQTLLYNLIDNARKASAEGAAIELVGRRSGGTYVFQIRDYGCGIPKEALPRLTEAFYMVDKSRARADGGAGLGLALCERIARVHGGHLRFESAEGQGTVVTVEIGGGHETV